MAKIKKIRIVKKLLKNLCQRGNNRLDITFFSSCLLSDSEVVNLSILASPLFSCNFRSENIEDASFEIQEILYSNGLTEAAFNITSLIDAIQNETLHKHPKSLILGLGFKDGDVVKINKKAREETKKAFENLHRSLFFRGVPSFLSIPFSVSSYDKSKKKSLLESKSLHECQRVNVLKGYRGLIRDVLLVARATNNVHLAVRNGKDNRIIFITGYEQDNRFFIRTTKANDKDYARLSKELHKSKMNTNFKNGRNEVELLNVTIKDPRLGKYLEALSTTSNIADKFIS
ncbi:hypothetical protein [Photobacterium kishitanii]|uniref:Uncharacterized protein n=1 Tax=Photobacterium kishitanii TaxID=318456 RepID=A0A2T3KLF0_9GAMM|nr:hypothetical protein [Photobacterium kishitanii]PSV00532.1 hypothetical protein C9J27_05200 [Photobacterium kishitanii]